ncbi:MAG TPA: transposase, partial [Thermodesulfovibrionia bacterium]|nr:transposase [Thermodesulfovibrionia bacterium]
MAFLQPALTRIQFDNLTLVASALVLGSSFNLTSISLMWLKEKCVSTLSYFFNDAGIRISELQQLYAKNVLSTYSLQGGYFIIDDTMEHHTALCKCIHGVCVLFDHALKTNLKAVCIVVLYYSDGIVIKFPVSFRIYYKEGGSGMPWQRGKKITWRTKYELALDMIKWALDAGFPKGIVLADSWYGIAPFVKEVKKLNLSYVLEIKSKGLPQYFESLPCGVKCGFRYNVEKGKKDKVLYNTKIATVKLSSLETQRVIQSIDPTKETTKYLITNELTWEAAKIISAYSNRWVIEEFFRNAKQLLDMEGAT